MLLPLRYMQPQQRHWIHAFFLTLASILPTIAHMLTTYQWDLFYYNVWTPPVNFLWPKLSLYYTYLHAWVSKTLLLWQLCLFWPRETWREQELLTCCLERLAQRFLDYQTVTWWFQVIWQKTFSPCSTCTNALDVCHMPQGFVDHSFVWSQNKVVLLCTMLKRYLATSLEPVW